MDPLATSDKQMRQIDVAEGAHEIVPLPASSFEVYVGDDSWLLLICLCTNRIHLPICLRAPKLPSRLRVIVEKYPLIVFFVFFRNKLKYPTGEA